MNEQRIWCFCWDGKIILDHCYLLSGHLENRSKQSHPLTLLLEIQGVISTSLCSCDPWFKHSCEMNQPLFFKCHKKMPVHQPNLLSFSSRQGVYSNKIYYSEISNLKTELHLSCYPVNIPNLDMNLNFAAQASSTVPAAAAL